MGASWATVGLEGFWLPFSPQTIAGRYSGRVAYVGRCREVAEELVSRRYLLKRDLPLVKRQAERLYDWAMRR